MKFYLGGSDWLRHLRKHLGTKVAQFSNFLNIKSCKSLILLVRAEQVNGRDELTIPEKVVLDVEYMERRSYWFDMRILWMTFLKVVKRDGVSH